MNTLRILTVLLCVPLYMWAQPTQVKASMEASVDSGFLHVGIYVSTLSGPPVPLGNTNFAFEVNTQALDITNAQKQVEGPYDNGQNSASYSDMLLQTPGIVNLTVRKNHAGNGNGVWVHPTPTLVARLRIPILNNCTSTSLNWITERGAFSRFDGQGFRPNVYFEGHSPIPLCSKPQVPLAQTALQQVVCPGDSIWISALGGPALEWTFNGDSTPMASGTGLWVRSGGTYTVQARECGCTSDPLTFTIQTAPSLPQPQLMQTGAFLFASNTGSNPIQWFLNGAILHGDTALSLQVTLPGFYKVGVMGPCGWVFSDSMAFQVASLQDQELQDALVVFPNPFVGHTNAYLTLQAAGAVRLDLVDARGVLVKPIEQQVLKDRGVYTIPLHLENIDATSGAYYLRATYRNQNKMIKLIAK